jgi:hypothetical protein
MKTIASLLALLVPVAAAAQDDQPVRWRGWCQYKQLPGERFPAPRLNLPGWVCETAFVKNLHAGYQLRSGINPLFIAGDFNADGRIDVAVWVKDRKTRKLGVAIFHGGTLSVLVLAAGSDLAVVGYFFVF